MTLLTLATMWFDNKLTTLQLKHELKLLTISNEQSPANPDYYNSWYAVANILVRIQNIPEDKYYEFRNKVDTLMALNEKEHKFLSKYLALEAQLSTVPTEMMQLIKDLQKDNLSVVEAANLIYNTDLHSNACNWLMDHEEAFALAYILNTPASTKEIDTAIEDELTADEMAILKQLLAQ